MSQDRILVCVAWPYANGEIHVGHVAGAYLPADIFARYHRLKGNEVLMVSGSDTHGTPITVRAEKEGVHPKTIFERYHKRFLETLLKLNISYDLFTHTDTKLHRELCRKIFLRLLENGYLFKGRQKMLYSEIQNRFLPDRLVEGTCPVCGYQKARGDECENCGSMLDGIQLINPKSRVDGSSPVIRETEHYFFDLPKLRTKLIEYLDSKENIWRPGVLSFSKQYALNSEARAFTRDLEWGISIPIEGEESKCIYVWYEALAGYLTATVQWAKLMDNKDSWKNYWYDPKTKIYNFLGKDNILFHTVLWTSELLGMENLETQDGRQLNLPYDIPANQYVNLAGQKFSKSQGISLDALDLIDEYGVDALRFYLSSVMPETKDTDWDYQDFINKNNSELLAKWGNLVQRVLSQIWRNFDQCIPFPDEFTFEDRELLAKCDRTFETVGSAIEGCQFRQALSYAMLLATEANRYLDSEAPWKTIKTNSQRAATQLFIASRVIDSLSILLSPFIPTNCERVHALLGFTTPIYGRQYLQNISDDETSSEYQVIRYDLSAGSGQWKPSTLSPGQKLKQEPIGVVTKLQPTV
ncbi:MAG: methionine--tRNA ligase [Anaerolineales bacterium]|nr:methionine--tRNA ligase [Anaerolineales bacterium]